MRSIRAGNPDKLPESSPLTLFDFPDQIPAHLIADGLRRGNCGFEFARTGVKSVHDSLKKAAVSAAVLPQCIEPPQALGSVAVPDPLDELGRPQPGFVHDSLVEIC